ncbi:MAG: hypothetical protein H0T51_14655 [Pirellulales bacterium]|nr:hypothetical protein [Pirellulales bacterium]
MRRLGLILVAAMGCGDAAEPRATVAEAAAAPVAMVDGQSLQRELESLEREATRIMDAIFAAEWPDAVDAQGTASLAESKAALSRELAEIDRKIAGKLPSAVAARDKAEARKEAAIWRQRVASSEARIRAAEPLLRTAKTAAERLIAENNASPVDQKLKGAANREATETVRSIQKGVAGMKLQLEKERRMLRLYE